MASRHIKLPIVLPRKIYLFQHGQIGGDSKWRPMMVFLKMLPSYIKKVSALSSTLDSAKDIRWLNIETSKAQRAAKALKIKVSDTGSSSLDYRKCCLGTGN